MQATIAANSEIMCGQHAVQTGPIVQIHPETPPQTIRCSYATAPPGRFPSFVNRLRMDARMLSSVTCRSNGPGHYFLNQPFKAIHPRLHE